MEDSFRVRADKVFGALGGDTTSSSGVSQSLWCLGDEEIERREWNRHKEYADEEEGEGGVESGPSDLRSQLESDLRGLSDNEEGEEEEEEEEEEIDGGEKKRRRNVCSGVENSVDEYFDVQSNIGRDCTLDFEEEEDHYDKVAVGAENSGDRLYMRDVKFAEYGIEELNEYGELPNTFHTVVRDPRANHTAAKIRLKEDAEAAGNFDNLQLSENNSAKTNFETENLKKSELEGENPKPILKKRDNLMDSRSQKRVRFMVDPESSTQTHDDQPTSGNNELVLDSSEQPSDRSLYSAGIPDYLRNPSKYTRYTFDSSDDIDDQSNRKAFMDFFGSLRKRNTDTSTDEDDSCMENPKSVVFMPRRKMEEGSTMQMSETEPKVGDNVMNKSWSVGITAEDSQESEVSAMEEDKPSRPIDEGRSLGRPGRKYRARTNVDVDDNSN